MPLSNAGTKKSAKRNDKKRIGTRPSQEHANSNNSIRKSNRPVPVRVPSKVQGRTTPSKTRTTTRNSRKKGPTPTSGGGAKRYRRVKVLKPCAIRLIFGIPLFLLVLERYFGHIFHLDDVKDIYNYQLGMDQGQQTLPHLQPVRRKDILGDVPDIANLTYSARASCPPGQRQMMIVHNPHFRGKDKTIPHIVHQFAPSRCLTRNLDQGAIKWAFRRHSYYLHDNNAVEKLFHFPFPEFPQLSLLSRAQCLPRTLMVGLWKYLVLWVYGGILADIDTYPLSFSATTISNIDDGFFLLENDDDGSDTAIISTKVMAVSPRHPLMYYCVQNAISKILRLDLKKQYHPKDIVGEVILQQSFWEFLQLPVDVSTRREDTLNYATNLSVGIGTKEGRNGRSVRIAGVIAGGQGFVTPIFMDRSAKKNELARIGMEDMEAFVKGTDCLQKKLE